MFPKRQTYCEGGVARNPLGAEYVIRISSMLEQWNDGVRSGV